MVNGDENMLGAIRLALGVEGPPGPLGFAKSEGRSSSEERESFESSSSDARITASRCRTGGTTGDDKVNGSGDEGDGGSWEGRSGV